MIPDPYQNIKFSTVRYVKGIAPTLPFVDLDAHAELDKLPKEDFIGMMGFGLSFDDKQVTSIVQVVACMWNDPQLVRLTKLVNTITNALRPETKVPVWTGNSFSAWMVALNDLSVEPTEGTDQRVLQVCSARFLTVV